MPSLKFPQRFTEEFETRFRLVLLRILLVVGIPFSVYYGALRFRLDYPLESAINFLCALIFLFGLIFSFKDRPLRTKTRLVTIFSCIYFLFMFFLHFRVILRQDLAYFSWFVVFAMVFFMVAGLRRGAVTALIYLLTLGVGFIWAHPAGQLEVSFYSISVQTMTCVVTATVIALVYEIIRKRTHKMLLERQQELTRSEEALERFNQTLEDRVKQRTAELEKANQHLKQEIQARQTSERHLRESEKRYRDLFENLSDFVYFHDMNGNFIENNFAVATVQKYLQKDREFLNVRDLMPQEYRPQFEDYLARIKERGEDRGYLRILEKNGQALILEYNNRLVTDAEGNPVGVRGSARNVTDRILLERERKRLEEQRLRSQKMESLGILAGGVAHDLNNVLGGIVSYPDLLLMQLPPDSPLIRPIKAIEQSGQKAAAIVQDLLTLARRGVVAKETVNLNGAVTDCLQSPEFEKLMALYPYADLKTNLARDLLPMVGSQVHLSKTVMNLIANAAEAMPEGGDITISTENRYVDSPVYGYECIPEGSYVLLTIRDTGIGISSEDMQMIFEPFYTKKMMGRSGTGLGMAVVWGTLKDHQGHIDMESVEGKGTTFRLYFPVTGKPQLKKPSAPATDIPKGKGQRILVVDDIKEQRDLSSMMLTHLGYTVDTVSSGEEAIKYIQENQVAVVVLDMIMDPGMDGLETFRRIREIRPEQKAVIASDFSETERVKKARELGAGAYLKKPFTLEKLGRAVKTAFESG